MALYCKCLISIFFFFVYVCVSIKKTNKHNSWVGYIHHHWNPCKAFKVNKIYGRALLCYIYLKIFLHKRNTDTIIWHDNDILINGMRRNSRFFAGFASLATKSCFPRVFDEYIHLPNQTRPPALTHTLLHLFWPRFMFFFPPPLEREVHLYIVRDKSKLPNGDMRRDLYVAAVVSTDEKLSILRLGIHSERRRGENIYRTQRGRKLLFPSVDRI